MEQICERVAGLDVHRDAVAVCVRLPGPRGGVHVEKARFTTTTGGLAVGRVAGGAGGGHGGHGGDRGVLEAGVLRARRTSSRLWLCNAQHVKNVPGRKTDLSDAEWLADVAAHGMVRPSFVPPPAIRELRELTRYRKSQVDVRASEIQRLEKVLQDAGIKLTSVASKVLDQVGAGDDRGDDRRGARPRVLAELAKGKLRPKIPQLTEALDGHFGAHQPS